MRSALFVALAVILGVSLGIGSTWATLGDLSSVRVVLAPQTAVSGSVCDVPPGGPQPRIEVDQDQFDFDYIEAGSKVSHSFIVTNTGKYPLCLDEGGTTCAKCTVSDLTNRTLAPGESTRITVEYHSSRDELNFRQSATILTNDAARPRIELTILGKIMRSLRAIPDPVYLPNVPASEGYQTSLQLLAYFDNNLEVTKIEFGDPEFAEFFSARAEPLERDEFADAKAKSGVLVHLTVKPGLPQQPIDQKIRLHTNIATGSVFEIPLRMKVVGDVALAGQGWNDDTGILLLGTVSSTRGLTRDLKLLVRGKNRDRVRVRLERTDPGWLKVKIGTPIDINNGTIIQYPVRIEVPPGSPATNRLGSTLGKHAEIVLDTEGADAKQLTIRVRMAVAQDASAAE
jgi:hypothetical protein